MRNRAGEKVGWVGGWIGGFLWLALLSGFWLYSGRFRMGLIGLALFGCAIAGIVFFAPWRHPTVKYRSLMLPVYVLLLGAIAFSVTGWGGLEAVGLQWTSVFWLFPLFIPLVTAGSRTWRDEEEGSPKNP